jgi:hypothetical protein
MMFSEQLLINTLLQLDAEREVGFKTASTVFGMEANR